ncbi:MAG: redox-regulated ATPase YchF [Candidatus Magasanikbacteria bacterium]|uniref:Ribosome-binding ATPase YchF n=1 Tax=Candidatus Magasanikbacteria bacterium CG10_big_fil_rev_8_21_14_0_10_38_6 TaxID=1974647 RepID=A0A2M6NZP0_9BACT|nr:redox-regulated ATPase YchF [Candidatus Magasanikbacteria bacterium]NCS72152.1 redox-regulated ATPase YchF [Candidatus Magasanikbacteria bacterium]PIR76943.1 MAG: redox-regulated ATPase YchF [Candidatus Magasanikbacteria bacterium CG10_big_fil_rev_8_21_14_0_10_38_6]
MSLSIGIVGLPNVGKSTLFNALTKSKQADAQNYPFCTIEPNVGIVEVPDERIKKISPVAKTQKEIPTTIEFIDIAGIVKGASEGEGLGNKFLSHIREVDAIAQVVRSFENGDITHVHNRIDPKDDADIINLELVLADWQTVSKKLSNIAKQAKGPKAKELEKELALLQKVDTHLKAGKPARLLEYTEDEQEIVKQLHLLTMKPMMYVVNVSESEDLETCNVVIEEGIPHVYVCARLEAELAELNDEDATEYMKELGMTQSGLDKIIVAGYKLLNLVTYFTAGVQEVRAWTVTRGTKGPEAAGVIHTDFIKGYIKADVVNWQDFVDNGGWAGIKETGKMQLVGKEYEVRDGDVIYFHVAT